MRTFRAHPRGAMRTLRAHPAADLIAEAAGAAGLPAILLATLLLSVACGGRDSGAQSDVPPDGGASAEQPLGSGYIGISDEIPTGSASISAAGLVAFEVLVVSKVHLAVK